MKFDFGCSKVSEKSMDFGVTWTRILVMVFAVLVMGFGLVFDLSKVGKVL